MFKPINTQHTNLTLAAPQDWEAETRGECIALPVCRDKMSYYSWWAVDWKSRIKILFGKPILLIVFSRTSHPPVSVDVDP